MLRPLALAVALAAALAAPAAANDSIGSMRLPLPVSELAEAVGMQRADPSTILCDLVRFAFASPDGSNAQETRTRAALDAALQRTGAGDAVPLPLSPAIWREHILRADVTDDRLAAAIFSRRASALTYYALFGMDEETLRWFSAHPAALAAIVTHAATAAPYGRSIRVRGGTVATPGEEAREVWAALVGASPDVPEQFIPRLLSLRAGRVAAFYDAVTHADAPHRAFAIGLPGDFPRPERAARVLDAVAQASAPWAASDFPFLRPDVDFALMLRVIDVDARGVPRPPASRDLWTRVFRDGRPGTDAVDAEWLARAVLGAPAALSRRRLDALAFAQRTFPRAPISAELVSTLQQHARFAALLSLLADNGVDDPAAFDAALRAASSAERDDDVMVVFQSGLAIVDRARAAGTLTPDAARRALSAAIAAAGGKSPRKAIVQWIDVELRALLADASGATAPLETLVLQAIAGPRAHAPPVVSWEGTDYVVDLSRAELRRLTRTRRMQEEPPLDEAIRAAAKDGPALLARSLSGIVYAHAMGDPDARVANGGAVWRRHRFGGDGAGQERNGFAWRVATEVFGAGGWHLTGSLLYLHVALAHMSLRRLDESEIPVASQLGTTDRRTIAMSIALADPRGASDTQRDTIAAALTRGRSRVSAAAADPRALAIVTEAAGIAEWRSHAIAWLARTDSRRVAEAFTIAELYRAGEGPSLDGWGGAATATDGCLCLRMPRASWEESLGRQATGQLGAHVDVMLRTAEMLSQRQLPAALMRDVAAYAACDALDRASPAWSGDWLPVAFAVRDIASDRFDDFIGALTAVGPLLPRSGSSR